MSTITRRAALAGIAALPAAGAPLSASVVSPNSDGSEPSEALLALLSAYREARRKTEALEDEHEAILVAVGRGYLRTNDPRHAAWERRYAEAGGQEVEDRLKATCAALWDLESQVYGFPNTNLEDVKAKARLALAHEDLKGGDHWIELLIRSLAD